MTTMQREWRQWVSETFVIFPFLSITVLETSCLGCTQCFTGANGNVQSYGFGTAQFLYSQQYSACFRQELGRLCLNIDILVYDVHINFTGYCSIQFRESSITSPDPFGAYILSFVNWYYNNNRLDDPFCLTRRRETLIMSFVSRFGQRDCC